ncbi:hypothetical protein [Tianweitania sediminis]|uniref:Uncharacterized protein n=1 Tax=Tianweitania sediminis TaxID=1502156 RepID=A0A8J7R1Z7_9HYPH|nr:hypothetical protein [Tianweitania sediminis]MBP0441383.1 hypothetical protein [Tianweitania sediminis]
MTKYRAILLGATASAALLGITQGASAFEVVDWDWTHTVTGETNVSVDVYVDNDPEGLVQVEKLQVHFGNISATSNVDGVFNNAAPNGTTGSGTILVNETFNFDTVFDDSGPDPAEITPVVGTGPASNNLTASLLDGGTITEGTDTLGFQVQVTGEVPVENVILDGVLSAVDLPMVENAATAVANNQSIEADVPLYLHDAQFAAGGFGAEGGELSGIGALGALLAGAYIVENDEDLEDINEHTTMAALLTVAAGAGLIEPAEVNASASVSNILNAYVDNAATAVTNNASFTIESDNIENHVMVADLTQWGYANVSAAASVNNVSLNGYTGFGEAGLGGGLDEITPIVRNAATAVGNNLSISVGMPDSDE